MKPSSIHGTGAFAGRDIKRGELIEGERSGFRGFNHSCNPNVLLGQIPWKWQETVGTNVVAFALRPIKKGEELTVWYGGPAMCNCPSCREDV